MSNQRISIFVCVIVVFCVAPSLGATITSISPKSGSIYGETRVSILGEGFDIRGRSNDVFIGKGNDGVFCDPVPNECHEKRIVCLTPENKTPKGPLTLTVNSFGQNADCKVSGGCTFEFSEARTPLVQRISPEWIVAPNRITVTGTRFTNGDPSVGRFDFTMHIADEERCQLVDDISGSMFQCDVENMYAGAHKLNVIMGDSGKASWAKPMTLTVYPSVSGVYPTRGSTEGGQLVTIFGTGFSKELADNKVQIHGQPCVTTLYNQDYIVCKTAPAPLNVNQVYTAPAFQQGKLFWEVWFDVPGYSITDDLVGTSKFNFPSDNGFSNGFQKTVQCNNCGMRWIGYFKPNNTGLHQFFIYGDDQVSLWLSESEDPVEYKSTKKLDVDPFNPRQIAFCPSATNSFSSFPEQTSAKISLTQGKYYWIAIYLKEYGGDDYAAVEVLHPNGRRTGLNADYVAYRPTYKPPITLNVKGLDAKYDSKCTSAGSCWYAYSEDSTPQMVSISTRNVSAGDIITITGKNFPTDCVQIAVTTGSQPCNLTQCTATSISCKIGALPYGRALVDVKVAGIGAARGNFEVFSTLTVQSMSPAIGSVAGGSVVEVKGSGFSENSNKTKVEIDNKPCTLEKVTPNSILCRVPNSEDNKTTSNSSTGKTAEIKVKTESTDKVEAENAFSFDGKYVVPGTTTADDEPEVKPTTGSTMGGLIITITGSIFNRVFTEEELNITIGGAACGLSISLPGNIQCVTGMVDVPGTYDVLVQIPNIKNRTATTKIQNGFRYVTTYTEMGPSWDGRLLYSKFGGATMKISGMRVNDAKSVKVEMLGNTLRSNVVGTTITATIPARSDININNTRPTFDKFDFTNNGNTLNRFFYSDDIAAKYSAQSSNIYITAGGGIITKKSYTRPFSFSASVQPMGGGKTDCIAMHVFTTNQLAQWNGYTFSANPSKGTFYYAIDGWVRETGTNDDWPKILTGSKLTWRIDVYNDRVNFYLNGQYVTGFADSGKISGQVGFGGSCQDIIVDDFEITDLAPTSLRVTVDGAVVSPMRYDAVYDDRVIPAITSISKTSVVTGDLITIMGVNLHSADWEKSYNSFPLSADATSTDPSSETLCSEITRVVDLTVLKQGIGVVCKVAPVTSGTRNVRARTVYGYSDPATAIAINVGTEIRSMSPKTSGSEGNIITFIGSGFPSASPGTVSIKVGTEVCVVQIVTLTTITCQSPKLADGNYGITAQVNGVEVPCASTVCSVKYTAATTPVVVSLDTKTGMRGDQLVIRGHNFTTEQNEILIGETLCFYVWADKKTVVCQLQAGPVGTFKIYLRNSQGIAIVSQTAQFEYKSAVFKVTPATGSINGGTVLTILGNAFTSNWQTSASLAYDFKSGQSQAGWTSNVPLQLTYCDLHGSMLGGYNMFGTGATITRQFQLPAHKRLRIKARVLSIDTWDGEAFLVHVDGALALTTYRGGQCFYTQCGQSTADCFIDIDFNIPHTADTASIRFSSRLDQDAADESWGLMNYALYYTDDDSSTYQVSIGDKPCPVRFNDEGSIVCTTPAVDAETTAIVQVKRGTTATPCVTDAACKFDFKTALTPSLTALSTQAIRRVSQMTLDFVTTGVYIDDDERGLKMTKIDQTDQWGTGAAYSVQTFNKDSDFIGITFRASRGAQHVMVGLNNAGFDPSYWDIDYALYMDYDSLAVYEDGAYRGTYGTYSYSTIFSIIYNRKCDCIQYKADNQVFYQSQRKITWPLFVDTSFYTRGSSFDQLRVLTADTLATNFVVFGDNIGQADNLVSIDDLPCEVFQAQTGQLWCSLIANKTFPWGGQYNVQVNTSLGASSTKLLQLGSVINDVVPPRGSIRGGSTVVIRGSALKGDVTVTIGGKPASIRDQNDTAITVLTPSFDSQTVAQVVVTVGKVTSFCGKKSGCVYNATGVTNEPTISDASSKTPVKNEVVKISGKFNTTRLPTIIFSKNGTVRKTVLASDVTDKELTFSAPDMEGGEYQVQALFENGAAMGVLAMSYGVTVQSVSPTTIGNLGGALVTFIGNGFGSTSTVSIAAEFGELCASVTRQDSKIICTTNAGSVGTALQLTIEGTSGSTSLLSAQDQYTPTLTAIVPAQGGLNDIVTITGTNLAGPTTSVRIGGALCTYISSSETSLVVRIAGGAKAGPTSNIEVVTANRGRAKGSATFTFVLSIFSVSPSSGPKAGGTSLTIKGSGFSSVKSEVRVSLGIASCLVTSAKDDEIICTTTAQDEDSGLPASVIVEITSNPESVYKIAPHPYTYEVAKTPYVNSFAPTFGSAGGGTYITISGTNFGPDLDMNEVRVGTTPCKVVSASTTSIVCMTAPTKPSVNNIVQVVVSNLGGSKILTTDTFAFELEIATVRPQIGSVQGGTTITLTGKGFGTFTQNYTKVYLDWVECTVLTSTYTQVTCATPPSARVFPPKSALVNSHKSRPENIVTVSVSINGTSSDTCGECYFEYNLKNTPTITSVSPSSGPVYQDQILTVTGTGFSASSSVKVGKEVCPTEGTPSDTEIRCKLSAPNVGKWRLTVENSLSGTSYTKLSCPEGSFLNCDGLCYTDKDCSYDEWGIYTCKELYAVMSYETFCDSNGGSDRINKPGFKTDNGFLLNFNCPMYDCEGQDCNTTLTLGGRGAVVSTCGPDPNGYLVEYRPLITAMTPTAASRAGGLNVTFTGTNLGSLARTIVTIGNAYCIPLEVSNTKLVCSTQPTSVGTYSAAVRVDGVAATCTVCSFEVKEDLTPLIDSLVGVAVGKKTIVTRRESLITIVGQRFPGTVASIAVLVGLKKCDVQSVNSTAIICSAPAQSLGVYKLSVNIAGMGDAAFSDAFTAAWTTLPIQYNLELNTLTSKATTINGVFSGSTYGGTTVTVTGFGFSATTLLGSMDPSSKYIRWTILNTTQDTIIAQTSATVAGTQEVRLMQGTTYSTCLTQGVCRFRFDDTVTPLIIAVNATSTTVAMSYTPLLISAKTFGYGQGNVSVVIGENACTFTNIIPASEATTIMCNVDNSQTAGKYPVTVTVLPFGYAKAGADFRNVHPTISFPLIIDSFTPASGSIGGGLLLTILGKGFGTVALTNVILGQSVCNVVSSNYSVIICKTSVGVEGPIAINVTTRKGTDNEVSTLSTQTFDFSNAVTPRITGVAPWRGSTAGGTEITISGSKLNTVTRITIDGVECIPTVMQKSRSTESSLICATGAHPVSKVCSVEIETPTGAAFSTNSRYEYVDLWSRWTTWGGLPPPAFRDSAVISEGQLVVLDYSPPRLHLIIVMGHLKADDADIELQCTYIMVNFGRLTVGTPEKPFTKQFTFTLFGDRLTPEIPVHGAKVIALRNGAIDLHGIPRNPTWTKLVATANAGDQFIVLQGPVDWKQGEKIVVTSTDYEKEHAEERLITNVVASGTNVRVQFSEPLQYQHYGEIQCFQGNCVDERAAVGHFTRNIVIQGDESSQRNGFGGTMFLMPLGADADRYARLSFVEFRDVGQQYIVGRYPVHFHVTGATNNSYCNGTSIYKSLNRAFSVHGVQNNTYVNNVGYDIHGHAFFIEDGSEKWNVIKNNLMMLARPSTSNLNTDLTPATFWIVSPSNWIEGNHAGGAGSYGFWISPFHPQATGPSGGPTICPATHRLWFFERNTAHSNGKYGVNIFRFWWPKEKECDTSSADVPAYLRDITVFKNNIHGITMGNQEVGQIGSIIVERLISADNGFVHSDGSAFWIEKISAKNMTCGLKDSVLIALTNNDPYRRSTARRGVNLPLGDNFFVENVTFVNYNNENFGFEPQAWAERHSLCFPYGWEAVLRGLKWVNSVNRIRFRFDHHGILNDEDGTLAGLPGSQVVPAAPIFDPAKCLTIDSSIKTNYKAAVCPNDYKIRRLGIAGMSEIFKPQLWTSEGRQEILPVIMRNYIMTAPVNRYYNVSFQHWYNPGTWNWLWGSTRYNRVGEQLIFFAQYNESRHHIYVTGSEGLVKTNQPSYPVLGDVGTKYRFDNDTGLFGVSLRFPAGAISVKAYDCPDEGCPAEIIDAPPERKACTSWEAATSWVSKAVPKSNGDVLLQRDDSICITPTTGTLFLNTLKVRGQLYITCTKGNDVTLNVDKWILVQNGFLDIGSATNPIKDCKVTINIGKYLFTKADATARTLMPWGIRTFAMESGEINVYGDVPKVTRTNLAETAVAGTKVIKVTTAATEWKSGQYIVVASTQRQAMYDKDELTKPRKDESEKVIIDTISADGLTINLKSALKFTHYGSPKVTFNSKTFYPGAEVAVLDRNVVFGGNHGEDEVPFMGVGWQFVMGCTSEGYEGCVKQKVANANAWPMNAGKTGLLNIRGVQFRNVGQSARPYGGINLDGLVTNADLSATGSVIRDSVVVNSYTSAIAIPRSTFGFLLENNVFFNVSGDGVQVPGLNNTIKNNLVINSYRPDPQCEVAYDIFWDCRVSAYRIHSGNIVIGNVAASGAGIGFLTDGETCVSELAWNGNIAHSMRDGVLVADHPFLNPDLWGKNDVDPTDTTCRQISGITTYFNSDHGIVSWYVIGSIRFIDIASVDDMIGFTALQMFDDDYNTNYKPFINVSGAIFAGRWSVTDNCRTYVHPCRGTLLDSSTFCKFWTEGTYAPKLPVSNVGIMQSSFVSSFVGKTKGEKKFLWHEVDSYPTIKGNVFFNNIYFDNFDGADACNRKNVAVYGNQYSNDTFAQHVFSNVKWGPGMKNDGEIYARTLYGKGNTEPGHQQTYYLDFDHEKFGGFWPDAHNKFFVADSDGTFTKSDNLAAVVNSLSLVSPSIFAKVGYDGKAFDAETFSLDAPRAECVFNKNWNAYTCKGVKYVTIAIDSMAEDRLTRRPGPVVVCRGDGMIDEKGWPLCQGGHIDIASGAVSHGKTMRATLERPARYYFLVENGQNFTLNFRGQPPTWMRVWMLNNEWISGQAGVVLKVRYFGLNSQSRVGMYVNKKRLLPSFGFGYPEDMNPPRKAPQPFDTPGTHYHDRYVNAELGVAGFSRNVMSFTVRPDCFIDLKQEPIIQVSMNVAMTEEDFFNNKDTFVLAMASVLGIDASRMRFANIVAGTKRHFKGLASSTKISLEIDEADTGSQVSEGSSTASSGNSTLGAVMNRLTQVQANTSILSSAAKALTNRTIEISGLQAQTVSVVVPRPVVNVTIGTPFIQVNISSSNFSSTDLQADVVKFLTTKFLASSPYNTTTTEFNVAGVFTDTKGITSCVFLFSYEDNNNNIVAAKEFYNRLISTDPTTKYTPPMGYAIQGLLYNANGAVIQTQAPTTAPKTNAPTAAPGSGVPATQAPTGPTGTPVTTPQGTPAPNPGSSAPSVAPTQPSTPQNQTATPSVTPKVATTATRAPSSSSTNVGAIAGGIVAAVVVIAIAGFVVYYIRQKRLNAGNGVQLPVDKTTMSNPVDSTGFPPAKGHSPNDKTNLYKPADEPKV
eukprot:PhF_6_TR15991/c1_g1_i1/m.25091